MLFLTSCQVYNVKNKRITLLDDGSGKHMEAHDYGPAAQYLFGPCQLNEQTEQQAANKAKESVTA